MQPSKKSEGNLDRLLKARAEIDEELRRHKSTLTVLFTDIVGSTHYFERFGDTAGLAMLHRHTEQATAVIQQHQGNVIKTIGDSVMAEFPEPAQAVRAAVDIQRQQWKQNEQLPDQEQTHLRIGVHAGLGFRYGGDVYGDVVNVAARVTKRTGPAQILISGAVRETLSGDAQLRCHSLGKITIEGRAEKEEVFEALWTDAETYADLRRRLSSALQRGDLVSPGVQLDDLMPVEPGAPAEDPARASLKPLAARYQVMGEVSRGGMGIVYKARDRETGELLALKVLKPEIAADQAVMERFKNELRLARKITHKNVCRIYDFHRSNGTAYISMEYVEGESLRAVLNRFGGLPLRKALDLARQIAAALREAHGQGIVHRDLKPENVMVDPAGNVKVMDFGIALSTALPSSHTGTIVGTPAYMAPEQAEGRRVDARVDIYALGLLLYEMLTNHPAFSGDTPVAVALKQIREAPLPPRQLEPAIPVPVEQAILRCLEKDPAQRFQTVDEFERALQEPGTAAVAGVEGAPGAEKLKVLVPSRPLTWIWVGGVVVLVIAGVLTRPLWHKPAPAPNEEAQTAIGAETAPPSESAAQPPPVESKPAPAEPTRPAPTKPAASPPAAKPARSQPVTSAPPPAEKPAASEPAPARTTRQEPAPAAAADEGLYLRVQSFQSREPAEALAGELDRLGYRVSMVTKSRVLWKSYEVRVGPYRNEEAAMAARRRLEAEGFKDIRPVREGE